MYSFNKFIALWGININWHLLFGEDYVTGFDLEESNGFHVYFSIIREIGITLFHLKKKVTYSSLNFCEKIFIIWNPGWQKAENFGVA